jgi:outer membrane protein OmpA-like peptidoglycan-associated protein
VPTKGDANGPDAGSFLELANLDGNLPIERRLQIHGLIDDLSAKRDAEGLSLVVPGEKLFAVNSEEIKPEGHETLARVAELISAYEGRRVMIIGHTDADGDDKYNEALSIRRASLVREFFVENFQVDAKRLSTEGRGETRPIATNDTLVGRQANRRIEVRIFD